MAIVNVDRTVNVTMHLREDEAYAIATLVGFIGDHTNTSVVQRVYDALNTAGFEAMDDANPFRLKEGILVEVKADND